MTMTPRMQAFSPGDVVIVPFPFTDRETSKRRPALVCSSPAFNRQTRHVVLAMITTATHSAWSGDVPIRDLDAAGLPAASVVRWKLFTLDASLVLSRAGAVSARDRAACRARQPVAI
jgi:mRNA interferase MazF